MKDVRLVIPAVLAVVGTLPQLAYISSTSYIKLHNTTSSYISEATRNGLKYMHLQPITTDQAPTALLAKYGTKYSLHPGLLQALLIQESGSNSDAYSPKGAIGLMQIMPFNAKRCGLTKVSKLWDEELNIKCGAQILSEELTTYKGNLRKALQAYNGGPKCLDRCAESIHYASNIINNFAQAQTNLK